MYTMIRDMKPWTQALPPSLHANPQSPVFREVALLLLHNAGVVEEGVPYVTHKNSERRYW